MDTPLEALFSACYRDVYGYLFSLCRDGPLAEELTAETFLQAAGSFAAFRGESDPKTWLFTLARRRWFAWLRAQKRAPQTAALDEFVQSPDPGPPAAAEHAALRERLDQLLAAEPPRTRRVVRLRLAGYSFYEIGLACGVSEASARVIDFRARRRIRAALEQEGYV